MNNTIIKKFLKKQLEEFSETAYCLWQKGWAEGSAGNISLNITDEVALEKVNLKNLVTIPLKKKYPHLGNNFLMITASGSKMFDLALGDSSGLLVINLSGKGDGYNVMGLSKSGISFNPVLPPSSELAAHLAVHNLMKKNNFREKSLIHTHCTELIALTHIRKFKNKKNLNRLLFEMHPEIKFFIPGGAGFVPFMRSGTEKIASVTLKEFTKHKLVLWEKHGCIAAGKTLRDSFDLIDIASKSAKIYFLGKAGGYTL